MKKAVEFFKKEAVLCISGVLAVISCFIVPPSAAYLGYIDFRVLALLFCLMLVVAGIKKTGAFTALCERLLKRFSGVRSVGLVMTLVSFFMSMLLTNDVTLVTVAPFTLIIFEKITGEKKRGALITTLVLETAAANLGSMLTPMGNPQNLYLYSKFGLSLGEFLGIIAPYSALSLALLIGSVFVFLPRSLRAEVGGAGTKLEGRGRLVLYGALFGVCMLTILRVLDYRITLMIVAAAVLIADRRLFGSVDYSLLVTFVFFFVFVGNLGALPELSGALKNVLSGREVLISAALSQVISNVPAAILLSGLTNNAAALLIGTNIGGLGTLIASMASLITYKFYAASEGASPRRYIAVFTIFNLCYLAALAGLHLLIA